MTTEPNLVPVRDVYDHTYHVHSDDLAGPRNLLKCWHKDGKPRMFQPYRDRPWEWQKVRLHRANICPHDRSIWQEHRFPDGSNGDYCPVCCPRLEQHP